ncbi:MAG: 30S ribosomal protein S16 [Bacteroidetes bacterium]|nr:MAG: 30S ribosomal protein S16 [Bacteroidota bacterium]
MSVKIRLARRGRKRNAIYNVVVANSKSPRDGRFIERLGTFNPNLNPVLFEIDQESAFKWLMTGAQPTESVRHLLSEEGLLFRKHLQIGVNKKAITQEQADAKLAEWKSAKLAKLQAVAGKLSQAKSTDKSAKFAAEVKVNQARIDAIQKKQADAAAKLAEQVKADATPEVQEEPQA